MKIKINYEAPPAPNYSYKSDSWRLRMVEMSRLIKSERKFLKFLKKKAIRNIKEMTQGVLPAVRKVR